MCLFDGGIFTISADFNEIMMFYPKKKSINCLVLIHGPIPLLKTNYLFFLSKKIL